MRTRLILWLIGAGAILLFTALMFQLSIPYASLDPQATKFLRGKYLYHNDLWRTGFYIHVAASTFVLFAGATQFSSYLLMKYPRVHRWMGWSYVLLVLLISGPGAFILAIKANGRFPAQVGFTLQTILWLAFTGCAFYFALKRKWRLHGELMVRSYALTLGAISLRLLVLFFTTLNFKGIRPVEIYITVAWLSWVPNLIIAEILIRLGFVNWLLKYRTTRLNS